MSQLGDNEYLKNRCIEDLVYVNKRIASGRNLLDSFDAEKKYSKKTGLGYEEIEKIIDRYNKQRVVIRKVLKDFN